MIRYQEGVFKMLGFSVYLGQNLDRDYILNMADLGYDVVFTSLQIPEEDKKNQMAYLGDLCQLLSAYQITYIIDVTPSLLNQTIYSYLNQLPHGDFYIRIDNQLNIDLIKDIISHGFKCCLNASTLTDSMLAHIYCTDFNNQLLYCHNYYPRPDTGLSISFIEEKNQLIRKYDAHAKICAFIPGTQKRGPLFKGLPTVEKHRFEHPLIAAQDLQLTGISDIIISDTLLSHIYAEQLSNMWLYRHFILHLDQLDSSFTSQVLKIHTSRLDSPEHVIRSQYSRTDNQQTVPMIGSAHRDQGDITIDNHLNVRYEGEIQVIKAPMPGHSHINCIGHVCDKDVPLLSLIQPGDTFKFVYTKENNK